MKPLTHGQFENAFRELELGLTSNADRDRFDVVRRHLAALIDERDASKAEVSRLDEQVTVEMRRATEHVTEFDALRELVAKAEATTAALALRQNPLASQVGTFRARMEKAEAQVAALRGALDEALDAIDMVESEPGAGAVFKLDWTRGMKLLRDSKDIAALHDAAVRKDARRAALKEAALLVLDLDCDPESDLISAYQTAEEIRHLAASEPEGE